MSLVYFLNKFKKKKYMGKLIKWVEIAKQCKKIPPEDDVINRAIYLSLNQEAQLKAFYVIEEKWPMYMMYPKQLLKDYVKAYGPELYPNNEKFKSLF